MPTIDERDYQVIQLIYKFKQLTANHINELLFSDTQSIKPCYRSLDRLYTRKYLHRLEHRQVGGAHGGSGQYVWTLATGGWRLFSDSPYRQPRTINFHTLEIANTYRTLVRLARAGYFTIDVYTTEPDCWHKISGRDLRPDLYIEFTAPGVQKLRFFLEVDMGSESEWKVKGKLDDTAYAFANATARDFPEWPRTLWIAPDDMRVRQLRRWINQRPEDDHQLFQVCDRSNLTDMFV